MSYAFTHQVGRQCLVTFQKNPRVLDEHDQAVRAIAAVADVESVGEETVTLLLHKVFPHRSDVGAAEGEQPFAEPDPPMELTLRSDAILSMNAIDDPEEYEGEDEEEGDEDDEGDDDPDEGEDGTVVPIAKAKAQ